MNANITPKPLPGGFTVGQIAATGLVRYEYAGTQRATWKEGGLFDKTKFTALRDVNVHDTVFAMPHFTPEFRERYRNNQTVNIPSVQRFIPAGQSFEGALTAASRMNGASYKGAQPVAIVQADQGQYYIAPLGYYTGEGITFHYGPGMSGAPASAGAWTLESASKDGAVPKEIPGKKAEGQYLSGRLTGMTALHQAVQAVVDRTGWFDLRSGSATVDASEGVGEVASEVASAAA